MKMPFAQRRRALRALMEEAKLDALVVTGPANWKYLTGFKGEAGALAVSHDAAALVTDGRFVTQARVQSTRIKIIQHKGSLFDSLGRLLAEWRGRRLGFDPLQFTVAQYRQLRKAVRGHHCVAAPGVVERLRMRKEPGEIAQMRKAAIIAGQVLEGILKLLKPGICELEVAAEIDYQMRMRGAAGSAFETIVAFGEHAALPHARPTAKRLRKNELVVLDLGAILADYCSDLTRTVYVGRTSSRIRGWYKAVLEAQAGAIAAASAGTPWEEVDAAARHVLAAYRLDRYFVHSTGHGLGLEVHEEPRIALGQKRRLEPGNVVTIEPGVYVPGVGGIRIEDDIAVHTRRTEILTRVSRDLIEL